MTARNDGRFKKEREARAAGVLALTKLKDDLWWVEVETVDSTPDTRLRQITQTPNGNVVYTRNIANVDWELNVDEMTVILKLSLGTSPRVARLRASYSLQRRLPRCTG